MKRKDAVEVKVKGDPFHSIVPYVMPKRTEAEVSATEAFDVTKLIKYLDTYNKKNGTNIKLFHAVCTACARTIYHRPKLNIFIAGRKYWQRNDISISFVAKQQMNDEAVEVLLTLKVKAEQTIKEISSFILGDVHKARKAKGNDLDKVMNFVGSLPRPILNIIFFVLARMEYHGIFPEDLKKGDPNYTTLLLSNLGSIKAVSAYHHLSNYGTNSIMATIGTITEINKKQMLPMTITFDERIADGFYFAKSLRLTKYLLENPKALFEHISDPIPEDLFK